MHLQLYCRIWTLLPFVMLSVVMLGVVSCASTITSPDDLVPQSIAPATTSQRIDGSVNVQVSVLRQDLVVNNLQESLKLSNVVNSGNFKVALEKAIAQNGLFLRIEQGAADYVLDVWVDKIKPRFEIFGKGFADMSSVWRLTRVKDGKVLVCDYIDVLGKYCCGTGDTALKKVLELATQETINNGLLMIADQSTPHMSAMSTAGLWPSMGPAVPEGIAQIEQNLSKLHSNMTIDEVEQVIGKFRTSSASMQGTQKYTTSKYKLEFIDGKLSRWNLRN